MAKLMKTLNGYTVYDEEAHDQLDELRESLVAGGRVENGYLVLTNIDGTEIGDALGPFAGGGGGGGGSQTNSVITLSNTSGWNATTVAKGQDCNLTFTWASTEDELPTGDGSLSITVNGAVKILKTVPQGQVTENIGTYLSAGKNVILVRVEDAYGASRQLRFTVQVVEISLGSNFDGTEVQSGDFTYTYIPVGSVDRTVYFYWDDNLLGTDTNSDSMRQHTYRISKKPAGAHKLEVFFRAEINGSTVESNHLLYSIICVDENTNTSIIRSTFSRVSVEQYTSMAVVYSVYNPQTINVGVKLYANDKQVNELNVDRTEQAWTYRADDVGTTTLKIVTADGAEWSSTFEVTPSSINATAETEDLVLYLNAYGRSNSEANPAVWTFTPEEGETITTNMMGFNFASDGWIIDEDGNAALRLSGEARAEINYKPLANDVRTTGWTAEFEFAARDVSDFETPIISFMTETGRGVKFTPNKVYFNSELTAVDAPYKEDEHIRVSFVIEKVSGNHLIHIYLDGVDSGCVQYPVTDDFSQGAAAPKITIGSSGCTTDIYVIRIYKNDLTRYQINDNATADTQNIENRIARYSRNNIFDDYGNIVIEKLPATLPYYIITCPELPQFKGDKKTCTIDYVNPVDPTKNFHAEGVSINVQGTSSQYYPRKNYKSSFKKGLTLADGSHADAYELVDDTIPIKDICFKTDFASCEGANNVVLAMLYDKLCPYKTPAQKQNSQVRQGIAGYPTVVFWNNGEDTVFIGKYNANVDKGNEDYFGFVDPYESWEFKNNGLNLCLFLSNNYTTIIKDEDGNDILAWKAAFEARYPEDSEDYSQLKEFSDWIVTTNRETATNTPFDTPRDFGEYRNVTQMDEHGNETIIGTELITYDKDDAEYRLAKFKNELGNYVELDSATFYYLFTELFLMADSRAKNLFPSFIGSEIA